MEEEGRQCEIQAQLAPLQNSSDWCFEVLREFANARIFVERVSHVGLSNSIRQIRHLRYLLFTALKFYFLFDYDNMSLLKFMSFKSGRISFGNW
jgi:hypothetical protein